MLPKKGKSSNALHYVIYVILRPRLGTNMKSHSEKQNHNGQGKKYHIYCHQKITKQTNKGKYEHRKTQKYWLAN